jgi:hypothetical protein
MPLGSILQDLLDPGFLIGSPFAFACFAFSVWMLIDAIRRGDWIWAVCILVFTVLSAVLYFFQVYRVQGPAGGGLSGFELPGARQRARLKEIQNRIYHLDHARDHLDLADILFSKGRFKDAEISYRNSLQRDPHDPDAMAHLGHCLLRLNRPAEARPLLEAALALDPKHDYGYTQTALAETLTALGDLPGALATWARVTANHGYARARVQYAELLLAQGQTAPAQSLLREVIEDDQHAPRFQRQRDRSWVRRARRLADR